MVSVSAFEGHRVHSDMPASAAMRPAPQAEHEEAAEEETVPAEQSEQTLSVVASASTSMPVSARNEPAGQETMSN